jgi:amino acid permease
MSEGFISGAAVVILCSWLVLFVSHLAVMPVFLRRLKRHDRVAYDAMNVGWFRIFLGFTVTRMFLFIVARRYMQYPPDMHKPGKILGYTWASPLLIASIALLSLLAYSLVTGRRLD